jgi:tellurite resistance protein TerC
VTALTPPEVPMVVADPVLYGAFAAIVIVLLAVDLLVVHRESHEVTIREAATWSAIWIGVSIVFGLVISTVHETTTPGGSTAVEFFTGYVIEKALSVDNVFLFVLIFGALGVPRTLQHRVLFYGVFGAIVMRTILIFTGATLIERFEWVLLVFGAFLVFAGVKTWLHRTSHPDIGESRMLSGIRRVFPTTDGFRGERFVVREDGRLLVTPLFIVLLLVELTDLVFAVDSIPAIFAVTRDPFIVLTSNVLAILGLRALYFLLAGVADRLRYLKAGLAVILVYVGCKLIAEQVEGIYHPSPLQSLGFIALVLVVVTVLSLRNPLGQGEVAPAVDLPFTPRVEGTAGSAGPSSAERTDAER